MCLLGMVDACVRNSSNRASPGDCNTVGSYVALGNRGQAKVGKEGFKES